MKLQCVTFCKAIFLFNPFPLRERREIKCKNDSTLGDTLRFVKYYEFIFENSLG